MVPISFSFVLSFLLFLFLFLLYDKLWLLYGEGHMGHIPGLYLVLYFSLSLFARRSTETKSNQLHRGSSTNNHSIYNTNLHSLEHLIFLMNAWINNLIIYFL